MVTGASAGVGRAIVLAFSNAGVRVTLIARGKEGLGSAERDIELAGGEALTTVVDVSDAAAVEGIAEMVEKTLGRIDVWVNNAMITIFAPVSEINPVEFKRVTDVTYLGRAYGMMAARKRMRSRNRGVIVQVSSALAYRSIPLQSANCGAKHALVGFIDSSRSELIHAHSHIHITSVQMPALNAPQFGWVRSKMPNRAASAPDLPAEVAANAILFAASHRRRIVPVRSPTRQAEWGQKFVPGLLDHYLAGAACGQQTDEAEYPRRPDNLFDPVARDRKTHGTFSKRAKSHNAALWVEKVAVRFSAQRWPPKRSRRSVGMARVPNHVQHVRCANTCARLTTIAEITN